MATSTEIKQRANALADKTDVNSITPKEVGGIMYDLASHSENVLRNGGTLGIRKVYESVAAMEADSTNPKDFWGDPIKKGNLVVIYDGTTTGVDNNKIYAFMKPGWQLATHLDAGYATKAETDEKLAELGSKVNKNSIVSTSSNDVYKGAIYHDGSFHDDGDGWEYSLFLVAPNDKITFKASGYNTNVLSYYRIGETPSMDSFVEGMKSDGNGSSSYKEYFSTVQDFLIAAICWYKPYGTPSINIDRSELVENLNMIINNTNAKISDTNAKLSEISSDINNISSEYQDYEDEKLVIENNNGDEIAYINEIESNFPTLHSNGKEVLVKEDINYKKEYTDSSDDFISVCDETDEDVFKITKKGIFANAYYYMTGEPILGSTQKPLNILIFGDSITDNVSISVDENTMTSLSYSTNTKSYYEKDGSIVRYEMWPNLLKKALPIKEIRNYARSGATYRDGVIGVGGYTNIREMLGNQIEIAINDLKNPNGVFPSNDFEPDIIIIALGTNDGGFNDTYTSAMAKTIYKEGDSSTIDFDATIGNLDKSKSLEAARWGYMTLKKQFPKAMLFNLLPIQRWDSDRLDSNSELRKMADRYSMIVIDGARELGVFRDAENPTERVDISDSTIQVNSGLYLKDGLHPNKLGQMVFARTISSCIKRFYMDIEMFNN